MTPGMGHHSKGSIVPRKEYLNKEGPVIETASRTVILDYEKVRQMAKLGCTRREIAAFFDIDESTLRYHERRDPKLTEKITKGIEEGKAQLRLWQRKAARNGQNAMLIWLGKQELGQTEKVDPRTLPKDAIDLSRLTDEQFAEYQRLQDIALGVVEPIPANMPSNESSHDDVELVSPTNPSKDVP